MSSHGKCMATEIWTVHIKKIWRYHNSPSMPDYQNGCLNHSITQWSERDTIPPFTLLGAYEGPCFNLLAYVYLEYRYPFYFTINVYKSIGFLLK